MLKKKIIYPLPLSQQASETKAGLMHGSVFNFFPVRNMVRTILIFGKKIKTHKNTLNNTRHS